MSIITNWMDKTLYPGSDYNWDNLRFRAYLLERIDPDFICMEFGAGRGNVKQMNLQGLVKFVAGVDIDPAVLSNRYLDDARVINSEDCLIPYPDDSFDVVFSDNVLEHVEDPNKVFREIFRVLKPGGRFISKTPNQWHYVSLVARATPTSFHKYYNQLRGREAHDTFPTRYRCNSKSKLMKLAEETGFVPSQIQYWEGRPEYLRLTSLTYFLGYLYERVVNFADALSPLRAVLVFELIKK